MLEADSLDPLRKKALETLCFDALGTAADITKADPKDRDDLTVGLAFSLFTANRKQRRAILGELSDTHQGMRWEDFKQAIEGYGFQLLSTKRFTHIDTYGKTTHPENLIAAHQRKMLLHATSFIDTIDETINGGEVYATINRGDTEPIELMHFLDQIAPIQDRGPTINQLIPVSFSVREGLLTALTAVEQRFAFVDWIETGKHNYINLQGYGEEHLHKEYTYELASKSIRSNKETLQRFLARCPAWVRTFMSGEQTYKLPSETSYDSQIQAIKTKLSNTDLSPRKRNSLKWSLAALLYYREYGRYSKQNSCLPTDLQMANPNLPYNRFAPQDEVIIDHYLITLDPV